MTLAVQFSRYMGAIFTTDAPAGTGHGPPLPRGRAMRIYSWELYSRWFLTSGLYAVYRLVLVDGAGNPGAPLDKCVLSDANNAASTDILAEESFVRDYGPEGMLVIGRYVSNGGSPTYQTIGLVATANQAGVGNFKLRYGLDWDYDNIVVGLDIQDIGDAP